MDGQLLRRYFVAAPLIAMAIVPAISQEPASRRVRPARSAASKPADEDALRGVRSEVYKKVGDVELKIFIFNPPDLRPGDRRPAIVFFFGGGWSHGFPAQFAGQCRYLASRGMVAMTVDYRVYSRHQAKVIDCVADTQSAVRWVRAHAVRLGIDPDRIAAGGGSAGGHLAASTALLRDFTGEHEPAVSCRPNALVLFNPVLDVAALVDGRGEQFDPATRLGAEPKELSPTAHVKRGVPPTIIFHGKADHTVPYSQVEAFEKAMKAAGNRCELVGFEGQGHGFFNSYRAGGERYFKETLQQTDRFLAALGYLTGSPTIGAAGESSNSKP